MVKGEEMYITFVYNLTMTNFIFAIFDFITATGSLQPSSPQDCVIKEYHFEHACMHFFYIEND